MTKSSTVDIVVPEFSLVVLIGASSAGKSSFARRHFKPTEIITSDLCRALVADDENDLDATADAFDLLHFIAGKRLKNGRLAVIDATNVKPEDRAPLVRVAREFHCLPVAIVLDLPERILHERNAVRGDRNLPANVIHRQRDQLHRSLRRLGREGFRYVTVLSSPAEIEAVSIQRRPTFSNRQELVGPFDILTDIHGCYDELLVLLAELGWEVTSDEGGPRARHPAGRTALFLGDLVDRGPATPEVLQLVMNMVSDGTALCVAGNHEAKLIRALQGRNVQITHGLAESLAQLTERPPAFREQVVRFIDGLISHYVLDGGSLIVAHAGMKPELAGRASAAVRSFALYGDTSGETDEFGLPVRYDWARDYRGKALIVYGHTPVPEPEWTNNTIDIDTGCVFGGKLTALRYPERELVAVPAARVYYQPAKPFPTEAPALLAGPRNDLLELDDVLGKRRVETPLMGKITVREENAAAALEVISRFAVDPRWLIYLPPTMSPTETSKLPDVLEHPAEAFAYYLHQGVPRVVCQEKHMGSRAVVLVCRDDAAAAEHFGIAGDGSGVIYTRTGRRFFDDRAIEEALLDRLRNALTTADFWGRFNSQWFLLDCELMPWSAKAQGLLRSQYAAVGAAGRAALGDVTAALSTAGGAPETVALRERFAARAVSLDAYVAAYGRYCWPVTAIDDLKLAPFHLLASDGKVHTDQSHLWHMAGVNELCGAGDVVLQPTRFLEVDVTDPHSVATGVTWWEQLTQAGGEGMVVKPLDFVVRGPRGTVQPAVKCRGPEYLRIIYGPEYLAPENLERLRKRGLGLKRSLAQREFALGVEGLQRFVRREPLHRVHECVFAVLALESEPVDPRL